MAHVLVTHVSKHTQQLVVAMEMSSTSDGSRHHDVIITSVQQQILDVTFQIIRYYGSCVVSCVSDWIQNLDLNQIKAIGLFFLKVEQILFARVKSFTLELLQTRRHFSEPVQ